tara:strand:+ start:109 stop:327 length:219 start_codon:yes stop_codon:yes gene_type:complete
MLTLDEKKFIAQALSFVSAVSIVMVDLGPTLVDFIQLSMCLAPGFCATIGYADAHLYAKREADAASSGAYYR